MNAEFIIVILLSGDQLVRYRMKKDEKITVGSGRKDAVYLKGLKPAHFRLSMKDGVLIIDKGKATDISKQDISKQDISKQVLSENIIISLGRDQSIGIGWVYDRAGMVSPETFRIPYQGVVRLGRWLPIGKYDIPEEQKQGIQFLNLEREGHYGIYGLPGTGKTTMLKTILEMFCRYQTPEDAVIYILDMGAGSTISFQNMPHVGGIAPGHEEEKFARCASILKSIIEERKAELERIALLKHLAIQMQQSWQGRRPQKIPVMPKNITDSVLLEAYIDREKVPVGYGVQSIQPEYFDLAKGHIALYAGAIGSGKSRMLCTMAKLLHAGCPEVRTFVLDSTRKGLKQLEAGAENYALCTDATASLTLLNRIMSELEHRESMKEQDAFRKPECLLGLFLDDLRDIADRMAEPAQDKQDRILRLSAGLGVIIFAAARLGDLAQLAGREQLTEDVLQCQTRTIDRGCSAMPDENN